MTASNVTSAKISSKKKKSKIKRQPDVIGWRELVGLPDLGIAEISAKIDTGARTSALHAIEINTFDRNGDHWVSFLPPLADGRANTRIETKVLDEREVKNTSGVAEKRIIIQTALVLGSHRWRVQISLADRENMEFNLIVGRTSFPYRGILVDPRRSFLMGSPNQSLHEPKKAEM